MKKRIRHSEQRNGIFRPKQLVNPNSQKFTFEGQFKDGYSFDFTRKNFNTGLILGIDFWVNQRCYNDYLISNALISQTSGGCYVLWFYETDSYYVGSAGTGLCTNPFFKRWKDEKHKDPFVPYIAFDSGAIGGGKKRDNNILWYEYEMYKLLKALGKKVVNKIEPPNKKYQPTRYQRNYNILRKRTILKYIDNYVFDIIPFCSKNGLDPNQQTKLF